MIEAAITTWSPQQSAFFDWCEFGRGSCVLEAVAGAGKTTSLIEAIQHRLTGQTAILAYNKKIADEIKGKLEKRGVDWKKAQAGTVHSFGFSAYRKAFPGVKVDDRSEKVANIVAELTKNNDELSAIAKKIAHMVSMAKQRALGVIGGISDHGAWSDIIEHFDIFEEVTPDGAIEVAMAALKRSNAQTDLIDFDDMVYMPLIHRVRFWQFDNVMVDEAQDTNPARRAIVRAMVKNGGRVIAVGDRHQAIYGFTGADADSLDLIAQDFNCIRLPLTITYRCPKAVVTFAQQWVSHIAAADTAPEGRVSKVTMADFLKRNDLDAGAAVLCRNTKPLVQTAFKLIAGRIACRVEGKDVGASLRKLATRWKVKTLIALETKLEDYLDRETTKLLARKMETKLEQVKDTVDTLRVIMDQCRVEKTETVQAVVDYIDSLFADNVSGMLILSTIHKSKGREWDRVFWLDRANTCPSKYARQQWQQEQEVNLMYVAATRAQSELIDLVMS